MFSQAFLRAMSFILGAEGELSMDPEDRGNWTGGEKGKGELKGTKFGISAMAYPLIDIAGLKREDAVAIYHRDYWAPIKGDQLPPRAAIVLMDCAVNQGIPAAGKLLQTALGFGEQGIDGIIGPATIAGTRTRDQDDLLVDLLALRATRYAKHKQFDRYGKGWMRRLFKQAMEVAR